MTKDGVVLRDITLDRSRGIAKNVVGKSSL
jgi:hypothetical protein